MMMVEPRPIELPDGEMMEVVVPAHAALPPLQMRFVDTSNGGEDPLHGRLLAAARATKKRADAWAADETRALIGLRREIDSIFNTSKSNKHLWERISARMRSKGYDRSPTMCTDKWRNLLKEFKKARHKESGKVSFEKEIEELIRERNSNSDSSPATELSAAALCPILPSQVVPLPPKVDGYIQFSDKGFENTTIQFTPVEASGHTVNLERELDHEADPLADITAAGTVTAGGVPPWNWRDTTGSGEDDTSCSGKVISVKLGEYTRKIGIDGTSDAIKDSIKSAFRLRTRRAFWLEDDNQVIRSIHREMPCGDYTLHLDEGVTVKVCVCDESEPIPVHTEEKIFYTQDSFREFLARRGWVGLREVNGYQSVDSIDDLQSGAIYEGVRFLA